MPSAATSWCRAAPQRHQLMQERWRSVEVIAAHLGVNRDTIYKWLTRKKMPAHKVGRLWRFLASEVDAWVKAGKAAQVMTKK
jgi:excisionase family DNA binding protein